MDCIRFALARWYLPAAMLLYLTLGGRSIAAETDKGKAGPQSPPAALALYSDAANLQNNSEYDLALEQWSKFLEKFPQDPLTDRARHYLGVCYVQLKQYQKAAQTLEAVVARAPTFEFLEDTYLNLGWAQYCHALAGNKAWFAKAASTFATLLRKYPHGKYVDQALFYQGESLYLQDQREAAAAAYNRLVNEYPKSKFYADGLYALGVTCQELDRHAEAGKVLDTLLEKFPKHPLVNEVRMRKAETLLQQGSPDKAESLFAKVAATKGFAAADDATLRQAFCAAEQGKFDEAAKLYERLVDQFPDSQHVAEATMSAGRASYRAGRFDDAQQWFQRVLEHGGGDSVEAAHWLCRILLRQKQPEKAAQLAARIIGNGGDNPYLVHLKLDQADALFEQPKHRADSLTLFQQIAQQYPDHALAPQALYNAAYAALDLKQSDEGRKLVGQFLTAYPRGRLVPDVLYVQAECYMLDQQYAQAEKIYRRLLADFSDHADVPAWQLRCATAAYSQDKFQQAVDTLSPVAEKLKSPATRAEAQFVLGLSYRQLQKKPKAVKAFEASMAADGQWAQADQVILDLARTLEDLGQRQRARSLLQKLIADFPRSSLLARAHFRLAECDFADGDFPSAAAEYARIESDWPQSPLVPNALYGRAWAHLRGGDFATAIKPLNRLIVGYPDHALVPPAHQARAICRQRTGDFQGGLKDITAFLQTLPSGNDRTSALYVRGLCEVGLGKTRQAADTFQAILDEDADYKQIDRVLYELGWAWKTLNKPDRAVEYFQRLATDCSTSPLAGEALFHVGQRHYEQQQYAAALQAYQRAGKAALEPALGEKVLHKIGWANFQLKRYQPALDAFTQQLAAYDRGSLAADGLFMRAECLFKLEDYEQAFPAFKKAGAAGSASETMAVLTLLHGGQSAAQLKRWDDSVQWLTRLTQKYPDSPYIPQAVYERGWALQHAGQTDEAAACYRQVIELSRAEIGARARFMLGELYFGRKDFAAAVREFRLLMYGYGGDSAPDDLQHWQAKGGLEAGRCAAILAGQTTDRQQRASYLDNARKYLRFVIEKHPDTDEAVMAIEQLKKYGT